MRDALFTLAMLVVFLANLLAMGEWYRFAAARDLGSPLFTVVLYCLLFAGGGLEIALFLWWMA
jgi:hypothetical protein